MFLEDGIIHKKNVLVKLKDIKFLIVKEMMN